MEQEGDVPGVRSTPGARKSKMLIAGGALVIGSAAAFNFLMAQPKEQISDLTLANIEAMAVPDEGGMTITTCLGLWGPCTLPDGTESKAPAVTIQP
ncbi:hypothetical protein [Rikenella microfusus]